MRATPELAEGLYTAPPMGYGAMRLRWCAQALRAFALRWGAYLLVAAVLVGAGSNSPLHAAAALAAWVVLPLFWAASQGAWLLLAWALQAWVGAMVVWALRALLWPPPWAETERALPLQRRQTVLSDALVVALALSPLFLLYAGGAVTLLASGAAWLLPYQGRALAALLTAAMASMVLGVALLQGQRQRGAKPKPAARAAPRLQAHSGALAARFRASGWRWSLLWRPLWRGPALRTGRAGAAGGLALCLPALALAWRADLAAWWLGAFAAVSLVVVSRVGALARLELAPLHQACGALPLSPLRLRRSRCNGALAPLALGLIALCAGLSWAHAAAGLQLRPLVFTAYLAVCVLGCGVEAYAQPTEAAAKASRWLLTLALGIALASETVR